VVKSAEEKARRQNATSYLLMSTKTRNSIPEKNSIWIQQEKPTRSTSSSPIKAQMHHSSQTIAQQKQADSATAEREREFTGQTAVDYHTFTVTLILILTKLRQCQPIDSVNEPSQPITWLILTRLNITRTEKNIKTLKTIVIKICTATANGTKVWFRSLFTPSS